MKKKFISGIALLMSGLTSGHLILYTILGTTGTIISCCMILIGVFLTIWSIEEK